MEIADISWQMWLIFFGSSMLAGFVDSIAGGGGLIALPVLLASGMPPHLALGTNKFQGTFGTLSASWQFMRSRHVRLGETWIGVMFTFVGAALGAWIVQLMNAGFLKTLIPLLLFAVLVYFVFSGQLDDMERPARMNGNAFSILFGLSLGFYDGFFGPGTGSFWMVAYCMLLGFPITKSAAHTRIMNFTSNVVSLAVFAIGGCIIWHIGLCMALGQFLGARIGARMAIRKGAGFIRPVFLTVVAVTIGRLVYLNSLSIFRNFWK